MSIFEERQDVRLAADDAAALDALMDAGLNPGAVRDGIGPRASRLAALLDLVGVVPDARADGLADVTFARVLRTMQRSPAMSELSPEDAEALDAWIDAGHTASRVPTPLRARAERIEHMASAVTSGPSASPGLVERTIARAEAAERPISIETARRTSGIRLADLVSVAAVLLIAGSIMWPVLAHMRSASRQYQCASNLGTTAMAFSSYAGDHHDSLPVVNASLDGGRWWDVGAPDRRSNSANLYELARRGYADLQHLACPGNPSARLVELRENAGDWQSLEEISYSYQNMYGPRPNWRGDDRVVVLSDRSPIVLRLFRGENVIDPFENSPNHDHAGQHVLFSDGSTAWLVRAELLEQSGQGDLLWWPKQLEQLIRAATGQPQRLNGTEVPAGINDAFVGP